MGTSSKPPFLERILSPVGRCLTAEAACALVSLRLDADTQARIDELADRCTEGRLTEQERAEYAAYVSAIDLVSILQSQARARLRGKPDAA